MGTRTVRKIELRRALLAAAVFQLSSVGAQESPGGALEEIVVTAQRRAESLQRAAIAVSVVTGDELASRGVTQVSDLTQLVPALRADAGVGPYNAMGIRGVATTALNAFADPAIAVNLDGVYLPRPWSAQALFFDIERVEVLKGPQGTLYGRNATAGAINVVSRAPDAEAFAADVSLELGNYDLRNASGGLNFPWATPLRFARHSKSSSAMVISRTARATRTKRRFACRSERSRANGWS
jgi:iron complex outermembrane recepter protein